MNTEYTVQFENKDFVVAIDGAGLDMWVADNATTTLDDLMNGAGEKLFQAIVDVYTRSNIVEVLQNAGAVVKVGA